MRTSAIARLVVMGVLTMTLLIPLAWVYSIVSERAERRDGAVADVSTTWGGTQVIGGPVLTVPYTYTWTDTAGRRQQGTNHANFLPRDLHIDGSLATETRRRGIFDVIVYRANLNVRGVFVRPDVNWLRPVPDHIDWDE